VPIIGLAHGSRHPGVRGPIDALMAAASELTGVPARAAYLDLTEPDLNTAVSALAAEGVQRAVIVPLLFTGAFHATIDVPANVARAAVDSRVDLVTAGILGTGDDVADVVASAAREAGVADGLPVLLYAVGSSDASANAAVEDLALRLGNSRRAPARAAFGTTEPRAESVLAELAGDGPAAIVPLFVSPGLLLDPMYRLARDRGWPISPPLGSRLAPIVAARYRDALT
jgi:sirohydrochlorin ferrochelatase